MLSVYAPLVLNYKMMFLFYEPRKEFAPNLSGSCTSRKVLLLLASISVIVFLLLSFATFRRNLRLAELKTSPMIDTNVVCRILLRFSGFFSVDSRYITLHSIRCSRFLSEVWFMVRDAED